MESYIPLNPRSNLSSECECPINENGIPCCPKDPSLEMKPEGKLITKSGIKKYKFVYPKMVWDYNPQTQRTHRKCTCESPCTASKCGRMFYIYPEQTHGLIPVHFAAQKNGITLTKSVPLLNVQSITLNIVSAWLKENTK